MPPYRGELPSRRSRRLSNQEPKNYAELEDQWQNIGLLYPDGPESIDERQTLSTSPATPSAFLFPGSKYDNFRYMPPPTPRPHRRQKGHITRSPNAFMLFRSIFWANEKLKEEPIERDHCNISRIVAHCWNSLDDTAKSPYQELAKQRKLQHEIEYPNYKYKPTFSRERSSKRRVKNDEAEDRCRKLASLVMDGVSSTGIREAMKGVDKRPSYRKNTSRSNISKPRRHSFKVTTPPFVPTKSISPNPKVESPLYPNILGDYQGNGFVPTEEIPFLELSPIKKEEECFTIQFDSSIQLPSNRDLDSHFGIKPTRSGTTSNFCFWNTQDDIEFEDEPGLVGSILPQTTNQVPGSNDYLNGSPRHVPVSDQGSSVTYPNMTAITNDPATYNYDSDMNNYFHFD